MFAHVLIHTEREREREREAHKDTDQIISESLKSLLCLLHLIRWSFQNDLVKVRVELHVHFGEVLGDLLNILSFSSDDESMEPARSSNLFNLDTVRLTINLHSVCVCVCVCVCV